jgi:hypothetical protein
VEKIENEELHNLYSAPNVIWMIKSRKMRWTGHVASLGDMINVYEILVGKPEGKRPPRRIRGRGEDILKWILGNSG